MGDCKAIDKIVDKTGKTIGYILMDSQGFKTQMKTDVIKQMMHSKKLYPLNLKLTSDNKLLHVRENDKFGLDVSPEVFFSGVYSGWRLECCGNHLRAISNKHRVICNFSIRLYNNNRAWSVSQSMDDKVLLGKSYSNVVYRDITDSLDDFGKDLERCYTEKATNKEKLELQYLKNYEEELSRRSYYEDDYRNGHSEDSEKAFYALKYLDENKAWYEANKHKLEKLKRSETKGFSKKFIETCKKHADKVECISDTKLKLESKCRGGSDYDDPTAYLTILDGLIYAKICTARGTVQHLTFKKNQMGELAEKLIDKQVFINNLR